MNNSVLGLRSGKNSAIISPMSRLFQPHRRSKAIPILVLMALLASSAIAQDQEKVTLRVKGEVGKTAKYASKADFAVNFQGETLKLSSEETSQTKVTKVNADGSVEFDLSVLTQKVRINGEDLPDEEGDTDNNGSIYTLNSRGITIATREKKASGDEEDDSDSLNVRLSQATSMVFAQEAVGVGSSWSHKFTPNKDWGTLEGTSQFKLVSFETVGGEKTAKIEFTYAETDSKGIKGRGTHWVEVSSGDVVKSENSFEQVPFNFGSDEEIVASLTTSGSKTSGSLFGAAPSQPAETKPADSKPAETKPDAKPAEPKPEEDKNSIDVKTKGWEKFEGIFTLYRKVEETRTRHFLEIKKSQLGQLFILQTTASSGNSSQIIAGDPVNDLVFTFEETPTKKIFLKVPNYSWQAPGSAEMERVLQRSFSDSYIESFDIEGRQPDRDSLLIDISQFFLGNISQLSEKVQGGGGLASLFGGGGGGFSPDREKSYIKTLKVYPTNLYAEVSFNFNGRGTARGFEEVLGSNFPVNADPRGLSVQVVYNLFALPKDNGFQMRRADSRVGYFQTAYRDWSRPDQRDQVVQNIIRWNLVKKDPKAELSEPVTPVTFWVDNAFPEKYRKPVADAILSWNKAFERIGFKNAIVVKQIPDKAEFDHADMRYNVIRFVASPGDAYAVANARVNPITGEILNASITVDANFLRAIKGEWDTVKPAEAFKAARAKLDALDEGDEQAHAHVHSAHSCAKCDLQKATAGRAAMGAMAILAKEGAMAADRIAQFESEYIYSVVQHEMGHILGLRHNFVASNQLTMNQLADPALVAKHNTAASVMDYIPYNAQALGRPNVPFFGKDLGDYDYWAIRYGYMPTGMTKPEDEAKVLAPIASLGARWGLGYQSDEQADGLDPFNARFDMSADPLAYYEKESQLAHKLLMTLGERKPAAGESYYEFTRAFNGLLGIYTSSIANSTRYLGGVRRTFAKKGDPGAGMPFNPVSGNDQRRALDLMVKGVFDEKVFNFPKNYYRMFQQNPKAGFTEAMLASYDDYAVMDQIAAVQQAALNAAFSRSTLSRIMNFDWKSAPGEKPLTVKEVFEKMGTAVWSELWSNAEVSPLRRQLHRAYLDKVIDLGVKQTSSRSDINLYAWAQLKEIHAALGKVKPADEASKLHYAELRDRAGRALNAVETLGGGSASSGVFDLASLLGRPSAKAAPGKS